MFRVYTNIHTAKEFKNYLPVELTQAEIKEIDSGRLKPKDGDRFYFGPRYLSSNWNHHIILHLVARTQTARLNDPKRWSAPEVPTTWLIGRYRDLLSPRQEQWKLYQPRGLETKADAELRAMGLLTQRQAQGVQNSRKNTKLGWRVRTCTRKAELELRLGHDDAAKVWRFFLKVLGYLDIQGMSSEDDASRPVKIGGKTVSVTVRIIRRCMWRADPVLEYMQYIDEEMLADPEEKKYHRTPRIRLEDQPESRKPAHGLPLSLYDEQWLEDERAFDPNVEQRLEMSTDTLELLKILSSQLNRGYNGKGKQKAASSGDDDESDMDTRG
ncbi:hypothetical protein R3P38DRAFT_2515052 [Favolaschia claudopus]|uniref:Uncharacterized protein n=1 Tax=Favolaschia claudopus TaxID=2862362 RepID=A0AAW0CMR4_9AGAR